MNTLSKMINKALSCDACASEKLSMWDQKILGIELLPMRMCFWLEIQQGKINIFSAQDENVSRNCSTDKPDAFVRGTPLDLMAAFFRDTSSTHSMMEGLEISGDVIFVQDLKKIFHSLHIDWQEKLAAWTNDHFAYWSDRVFQKTKKVAKFSVKVFMRDLKEYLEDEQRTIVSKDEVNDFCSDVDSLQHAVDRLYARWTNL